MRQKVFFSYFRYFKFILFLLFFISACSGPKKTEPVLVIQPIRPPVFSISPDAVALSIKEKIAESKTKNRFICRSELVCGITLIPSFYKQRQYYPLWIGNSSKTFLIDELLEEIKTCIEDGLTPENYHLKTIENLLKTVNNENQKHLPGYYETAADLDILLTDAFLLLSSHLLSGRVNPETIHVEWQAFSPDVDLANVLDEAVKNRTIRASLQNLSPPHSEYKNLKTALEKYRTLSEQQELPGVSNGMTLRYGDSNRRVGALRNRLFFWGDIEKLETSNSNFFDVDLEKAVKGFQQRHGLTPDGLAGNETIAALNISAKSRVRQIELNLERWRWLPRDLGTRFILVNIADFKLTVTENSQPIMEMKVVVGKPYRKTPVFSKKMQYLVLNPFWNVPTKLALEDLAPKLCATPEYIEQHEFKVFQNWLAGSPEIDPASVNWCDLTPTSGFPYKLQQASGPYNPLGRIKFIFPNKYSVYLHDTPNKSLFDKALRNFSSGCIRVEKPYDLAEYLLRSEPEWTKEVISKFIESGNQKTLFLSQQIPVHLVYLTAWADAKGIVHFRNDIYEQDKALDTALNERPPIYFGD